MKVRKDSGFTLIELLVVIAVIGILASVVLASVRSSQNKATDKAIISNMLTIRLQSAIYFEVVGSGSYGATATSGAGSYNCGTGMFNTDQVLKSAVEKIRTYTGYDYIACSATLNTYAVAAQLKATNDYFCIDSNQTGKIKSISSAPDGLIGYSGSNSVLNLTTSLCN